MNDKKLPQVPPPEKREPSLSELSVRNAKLAAELDRHTNARSYLWSVISGQSALPILTLSSYPLDINGDDPNNRAAIDMSALPQDAIEGVMYTALLHEEQQAIETWQEITKNANAALKLIKQIQDAKEKDVQKSLDRTLDEPGPGDGTDVAEEDEFPATLPMMNPAELSPAEVPKGWPGR
jgi:hypothetical protein